MPDCCKSFRTVTPRASARMVFTLLVRSPSDAGVDEMLAMCGGCCSCATCHVYIEESGGDLSEPSADEDDLLDSTGCRTSQSRLACQVRLAESTIKRARIAPED